MNSEDIFDFFLMQLNKLFVKFRFKLLFIMIQMRIQNAFDPSVHSIAYLGTISMLFYEYVAQMTLETKAAEKYTNAEGRIFF